MNNHTDFDHYFIILNKLYMHLHSRNIYLISLVNIYIFVALALDESVIFNVLHFPMKNI